MRPITRETITDRRQPALRWSAVFAGVVVSVALWMLWQLFGMGAGLAAIDLDSYGSLRSVGIGTTVWSMIAPLFAMLVGGIVAGRLATTFDQKVGAMHGFVVWSIASVIGLVAMACMLSMLVHGAIRFLPPENVTLDPSLHAGELKTATAKTGQLLLGIGVSMLLGMVAAIVGGLVGARKLVRPRRTTAEVPVVPPPAEPPADAPHVTT